ncbi:MAG: prepilin-type N-terminal cleavage/methylation domain-containing protein [Oscillospiraceae bacterium]|nr:prepilin-type N-terminal cleavage/methylation domain-containing protein [Oscillospiraceae bacterium]
MKFLQRCKIKSGFSLVECVIAIAVFSIMSMIVATMLNASITTHLNNMSETRSLRGQRHELARDSGTVGSGGVRGAVNVSFNFNGGTNNVVYPFVDRVVDQDNASFAGDWDLPKAKRTGLELTGLKQGASNGNRKSKSTTFETSFTVPYITVQSVKLLVGSPSAPADVFANLSTDFGAKIDGATALNSAGVQKPLATIHLPPGVTAANAGADGTFSNVKRTDGTVGQLTAKYAYFIRFKIDNGYLVDTVFTDHTFTLNFPQQGGVDIIEGIIAGKDGALCQDAIANNGAVVHPNSNGCKCVKFDRNADSGLLSIVFSPNLGPKPIVDGGFDANQTYTVAILTSTPLIGIDNSVSPSVPIDHSLPGYLQK